MATAAEERTGEDVRMLLSARETARRLGVNERTIREGIRAGTIPAVVLRKRPLVPATFVERALLGEQGDQEGAMR